MRATEVAKMFGCSREFVFRRITTGKLPARKVGRFWEIDLQEAEKCFRKWPPRPNPADGKQYVDREPTSPSKPCFHPPGSLQRIETYRHRAKKRACLFHPEDETL